MSIEPAVLAALEAELDARRARHHTTLLDDQTTPAGWAHSIQSYALAGINDPGEFIKAAAVAIAAAESAARLKVLAGGEPDERCDCPPTWVFRFGFHPGKKGWGHHVRCPMYVAEGAEKL